MRRRAAIVVTSLALIALLQQAIDRGYFLESVRVNAQDVAARLVNLLRAGR